ncbi:MAG TPA: hypothetical protein VHC21_01980 [Candidatus Saccharimonadales bacterium]|nr:hypothetical protein [Candidatus Saccharimonadales bacterium]
MSIKQFAEKQTKEAESERTRYENCHKANDLAKDIWELGTKLGIITENNRLSYRTSSFKLQDGPEIMLECHGPEYNDHCAIRVKTIEQQSERYAWIAPKLSKDSRDPEKVIDYADDVGPAEDNYLAADTEVLDILEQIKATLTSQPLAEPIVV